MRPPVSTSRRRRPSATGSWRGPGCSTPCPILQTRVDFSKLGEPQEAENSHCSEERLRSPPMSTQKTSLDSIVCAAVEIASPEERTSYIVQACGDDQDLRLRAEKLVAAHFHAGSFLDKPIPEQLAEQGTPDRLGDTQDDVSKDHVDMGFLQPSDKPELLGQLGHYEILEVIGKGGMGIVLRAFDSKLHRVVAIKVMAQQLAANAVARKRFIRE